MPHILLTGAGFSRNWGGWLADEAFEYLLGHPQSDDSLRSLLWKHKTEGGGFEAAFSELQTETPIGAFSVPMLKLNEAIRGMFADMNEAFATITFEFQNSREYQLRTWLFGFDAIFTLNQDVLMEQHYLTSNFVAASRGRWSG